MAEALDAPCYAPDEAAWILGVDGECLPRLGWGPVPMSFRELARLERRCWLERASGGSIRGRAWSPVFDDAGRTIALRSASGDWEISPLHAFGRPRIASSGVPVEEVLSRYRGGDSAAKIAADYRCSVAIVEATIAEFGGGGGGGRGRDR